MFNYVQLVGGDEEWQPVPAARLQGFTEANKPMFVTVLSVSSLVTKETTKEELDKLSYIGPMYFDWDGSDIADVTPNVIRFIEKLQGLGVDPETLHLFATGGKGYHCELPAAVWADKIPKAGFPMLPVIFKEIALELAVDTLDLRVYSTRRGRMWRQPNVQRPNGKYKVPISFSELKGMTPEQYNDLTGAPRAGVARREPAYALDLAMLFVQKQQKVVTAWQNRKKSKVAKTSLRADAPSLTALCEGRGLKPGTGFNQIAVQLAIAANNLGWSEDELVRRCQGLISSHQSDGNRYNTESKRAADLIRMHRYMEDNPCYDLTIGGLKSILCHSAPDLEGIPVSKEDVDQGIQEAAENPSEDTGPDEYEGLTGVTLNRYGVYANTEAGGKKRVCAVSFDKVETLRSMETGTISAIEADIMVNGKRLVRQCIELDTFGSVQSFNKFCSRLGHAFQGSDSNIRGLYMSVVEKAKKNGKEIYVTSREGLDIVNIPNHENEQLREPFMIWADSRGVVLEPKVADSGVNIRFQGYPDTRGQFKIDLGDAPPLVEWLKEDENKAALREVLTGMFNCQRPEVISKMVGWSVACFYRMLFHKAYGKFPLLHVNAPAGTGKSEMSKACLGFFYYHQEPRILSPSSTLFSLSYSAAGSVTPPLMIDEYKPHRMSELMRERLKLMFRDAYNAREQSRGGGTRDNDDYRSIHTTVLSAPMAFIAEALEEESAVMERVVLVTVAKPHPAQGAKDYANFIKWQRGSNLLAVLGQYIASQIVKRYSLEQLQQDFDEMYNVARKKFMLTEEDLSASLSREELMSKQSTKERTVYNYTVAAFGLHKLANLVEGIFPGEFSSKLDELRNGVYARMDDLASTTQPEWLKVFNAFSDMTYLEDNYQLNKGKDYAVVQHGGRTCLELYIRVAYNKYRAYCRAGGSQPLYSGEAAFVHGLRDSQALVPGATNIGIQAPGGSMLFDMDRLTDLGFRGVKAAS